jgi:hypothetical protein
MNRIVWGLSTVLFAALPATTNYELNSYGFGSGGTANSGTATYSLEGSSGALHGPTQTTSTYNDKPGFIETQQANVPKLSTFDNPSNYYNKLHFVIDKQNNPTDALYALSISTDNFTSDIRYVKSDLTVGSSLVVADYKSYAAWGSTSGSNIVGLLPHTTYKLRVKATQGKYTESAFGPSSSAATVDPQLSFSISTNSLALGSLLSNTVIDAPQTINVTFATNGGSGGDVYINGATGGLLSSRASASIPSATGDLSGLSHGFGAQVTSVGATSGTLSKVSPYNLSSQNVGITNSTLRSIFTTTGPLVGGTGSVLIKAKSAATDPAANDYTETLTMLASASF